MTAPAIAIAGREIQAGERARIDIPLPNLYTTTPVFMPVHVIHGRRPGPRLFITASLHGDEINGVEIIRRLLLHKALKHLQGTLLAVPVVNVYGYVRKSRYLPDRRDLNRSFPGSGKGSLASRLAATLISEIVEGSTHGIDLHTGAIHRENLPQIRVTLNARDDMPALAKAFDTPVILDAEVRPGSLRAEAVARGIPLLLYEAGEALRFDEFAVRAGLSGILGVMRHLGMIRATQTRRGLGHEPLVARSSVWVRAQQSGILLSLTPLGAHVNQGDRLGIITDPFRPVEDPVLAPVSGIVIGRTNLPLITEGEALYHLASFGRPEDAAALVEQYRDSLDPDDEEEEPVII
jgi:predicted deacylase